eukprot:g5483.t1
MDAAYSQFSNSQLGLIFTAIHAAIGDLISSGRWGVNTANDPRVSAVFVERKGATGIRRYFLDDDVSSAVGQAPVVTIGLAYAIASIVAVFFFYSLFTFSVANANQYRLSAILQDPDARAALETVVRMSKKYKDTFFDLTTKADGSKFKVFDVTYPAWFKLGENLIARAKEVYNKAGRVYGGEAGDVGAGIHAEAAASPMHANVGNPGVQYSNKEPNWNGQHNPDNVADRLRATTIDSATPVAEQEMQDSHSRLNNLDLFEYAHAAKTIQDKTLLSREVQTWAKRVKDMRISKDNPARLNIMFTLRQNTTRAREGGVNAKDVAARLVHDPRVAGYGKIGARLVEISDKDLKFDDVLWGGWDCQEVCISTQDTGGEDAAQSNPRERCFRVCIKGATTTPEVAPLVLRDIFENFAGRCSVDTSDWHWGELRALLANDKALSWQQRAGGAREPVVLRWVRQSQAEQGALHKGWDEKRFDVAEKDWEDSTADAKSDETWAKPDKKIGKFLKWYKLVHPLRLVYYAILMLTATFSVLYLTLVCLWVMLALLINPQQSAPYAVGVAGLVLHIANTKSRWTTFMMQVKDKLMTQTRESSDPHLNSLTEQEVDSFLSDNGLSSNILLRKVAKSAQGHSSFQVEMMTKYIFNKIKRFYAHESLAFALTEDIDSL